MKDRGLIIDEIEDIGDLEDAALAPLIEEIDYFTEDEETSAELLSDFIYDEFVKNR
jgi:hypothetical protein